MLAGALRHGGRWAGMLGGGYGDEVVEREFDLAEGARVGCGLIT
jgi:nitronate monooxygenase